MPTITVVVPAYNEEKYLEACLQSLLQNGPEGLKVIVVNNGSTDGTSQAVLNFSQVTLVNEAQKNLPRARNIGVALSDSEIIVFVDADNRVTAQWFSTIQQKFEADQRLIALSGPYAFYDLPAFYTLLVWLYWRLLAWPLYRLTGYMAVFGNLAVRKEALAKIGGIDERIAFYGDDVDIVKRLSKVGKTEFSLGFQVSSSARRLKAEGLFTMAFKYGLNYLWMAFKGKPKDIEYQDFR